MKPWFVHALVRYFCMYVRYTLIICFKLELHRCSTVVEPYFSGNFSFSEKYPEKLVFLLKISFYAFHSGFPFEGVSIHLASSK